MENNRVSLSTSQYVGSNEYWCWFSILIWEAVFLRALRFPPLTKANLLKIPSPVSWARHLEGQGFVSPSKVSLVQFGLVLTWKSWLLVYPNPRDRLKAFIVLLFQMQPLNFSAVCATIFTKCKMSVLFAAETMDESS